MGDQGKKRGPEWDVRINTDKPNRLRRDTAFLCNIRFRNDLPEIPCDPKLLLPPYDRHAVSAFKLTELEKELRKDLLLEPDLGIPIHPWNIERYSVPEVVPPLHPADAELVKSDEELEPKKARLRGAEAEVSWLMRTKYMTAEAGMRQAPRAKAAAAAQQENEDPREERLRQVEAQFEAARGAPVHPRDPSLTPLELEGLSAEAKARAAQAHLLKSFRTPTGQPLVALLVPQKPPPPGDDELSAVGGVPGAALAGDYDWVREYLGTVRLDDTGGTFLFRFADDGTVRFHDLNTKLGMRKRKRVAADDNSEGDGNVLQPEKVMLRLPGQDFSEEEDDEGRQQNGGAAAAAGSDEQAAGGAVDWGEEADGGGGSDAGGGGDEEGGRDAYQARANAALRDAFGSDDDDD